MFPTMLLELSSLILPHLTSADLLSLTHSCRRLHLSRRELFRALVRAHLANCAYDPSRSLAIGRLYFGSAVGRFVFSRAVSAVAAFDFRARFRRQVRACFEDPVLKLSSLRVYLLSGVERMRVECAQCHVFETLEGRHGLQRLSEPPHAFRYATHHVIPIQYPSADARWAVQVMIADLKHLALRSFVVLADDVVGADLSLLSPPIVRALELIGERAPRWLRATVEFDVWNLVVVSGQDEEGVRRFLREHVELEDGGI